MHYDLRNGMSGLLETTLGGAVISLLIGLLLGLERERSQEPDESLFAGIRTFPILALAGYFGGVAGREGQPLVLPAVLLAIGALAVAAYLRTAPLHAGATTEATALLAPLLGAAVAAGHPASAASLAVIVTLLLTLKAPLHKLAGSVSADEILAILKFAIVAVVLVPLLPAEAMGPHDAIEPRKLGIVIVMLTGLSLAGYLLVRLLGARIGWALAGAVGGLASSTAVTLSFSGKAREVKDLAPALAVGIVLASTILYARGLVVVGLLDTTMAAHLAPRLIAPFAIGLAFALARFRAGRKAKAEALPLGNPVELGRAVMLTVVFAAVLLASAVAQAELGTMGLWAVALLGGLVDVDSVSVAAARLRQEGVVAADAASGAYLLATVSNLALKSVVTAMVGGAALAKRVLPAFAAMAAATLAALLLT